MTVVALARVTRYKGDNPLHARLRFPRGYVMLPKFRVAPLFFFALALAGSLALRGGAQDTKVDPITERMRKDITFLASPECEGRGVGTKGLDLAADYIAEELKK